MINELLYWQRRLLLTLRVGNGRALSSLSDLRFASDLCTIREREERADILASCGLLGVDFLRPANLARACFPLFGHNLPLPVCGWWRVRLSSGLLAA